MGKYLPTKEEEKKPAVLKRLIFHVFVLLSPLIKEVSRLGEPTDRPTDLRTNESKNHQGGPLDEVKLEVVNVLLRYF